MRKSRTVCVLLLMCILSGLLPTVVSAEYTDVYPYDSYYHAVNRLQDLGIVSGYEDGTFQGANSITRAEFAKLIVCAMDAETEAKTFGIASKFHDVPQGNWAVPYIAYITSIGLVSGYPDGSFGPYNTITYAEILTIIGKMLGYTEDTIGYYWPTNYIEMAASVGITAGLNFYPNQTLNRAVAAIIVDRALFTKVSKTAQTSVNMILLEKLGYTVVEDALVLATGAEDESLFTDEIKLNNSQVYSSTIQSSLVAGDLLKYAVVNSDGEMVAAKRYGEEGTEGEKNKYTVLEDCYIIASSVQDRTLSSMQIRTSKGVFTVSDTSVLNKTGEVGKLVLDKDKKVLSASTTEAVYREYIVSDSDDASIQFISNHVVSPLQLSDDFPIYVDYGEKEIFQKATKKFTAGSELTLYSTDGYHWACGVLDRNAGYTVLNDCFIIASKNQDETLAANQVRTSNGTYQVTNTDMLSLVGQMGTVLINKENKIEQFAPTNMVSKSVVVNKVNGNTIDYSAADGSKGSYRFDNTFVTYLDYAKSTYALTSHSIDVGSALTFYGASNGSWSFAVIDTAEDITPVLASRDYSAADRSIEGMTVDYTNLTIYRDGRAATISDIKKNDVIYYNTRINTMDVYTKKVTGIYYDALPSKAYVTQVMVGGKTYKIGETSATVRLDASNGAFNIGDKVTLLLGKNDEVVFAVELTDFDTFNYGVIVSTGQKAAESGAYAGSSEIYAKIFMPDGETYEYVTDKDYKDYKGKLVNLKYNGGKVSVTLVSTASKTYGKLDITNRTLGGKTVLKDVKIIQRVSGEDDSAVRLETLNFETLETPELTLTNVIASVSSNSFGDIGILYVTGLGSSYSFGVMKSRTDAEAPYTYSIYNNSTMNTYISESKYGIAAGAPVMYRTQQDGTLASLSILSRLDSASGIGAVEGSRIMLNNTIYKMSSDVQIINTTDRDHYKTVSIDELASMKGVNSVAVYSDKSVSNGGIVKVVTVTTK